MKFPIYFVLILILILAYHQPLKASEEGKEIGVVKLNGAYALVGVINPSVEIAVGQNFSLQLEAVASPWQSYFHHEPLVVCIGFLEGRWYPHGVLRGFFIAPCVGYGTFLMQRSDYWNSDAVQHGSTTLLGVNVGYVYQVKRFSLELFLGGGYSASIYEGYNRVTNNRYDEGQYPGKYNRSAEWLPFKGGLNVGYRF